MKVQERLLDRGEALTVHKAIEICQQYETSKKQVRIVRKNRQEEDTTLNQIHTVKHKSVRPNKMTRSATAATMTTVKVKQGDCKRCGTDHKKTKGRFPAMGTTCSYYKKENHWARVCMKRVVDTKLLEADEEESGSEEEEVLAANSVLHRKQPRDKWDQRLDVNSTSLRFKIDTGARCNTLTLESFHQISDKVNLVKKVLKTYSGHAESHTQKGYPPRKI